MILRGAVEPIRHRRILYPGIERPDVIWDHVEKYFHVLLVSGVYELLIFVQRSEVRVDGVQIRGAIAVIILRCAILDDGSEPQSCHAQILQVRKMVLDSAQIAAVIRAWLRAVVRVGKFGRFIVGGIAVGEAVGHDQVDHVVGREALISAGDGLARGNRKIKRCMSDRGGDAADGSAGF